MKRNPILRKDYDYLIRARSFSDEIDVDLARTPKQHFDAFIAGIPSQVCNQHPQANVGVNVEGSEAEFRKKVGGDMNSWSAWTKSNSSGRQQGFPSIKIAAYCFRCLGCKLEYAGVPPEFQETSFESWDSRNAEARTALEKAMAFSKMVETTGRGFALLCGLPGNGKTRLASNIIRAVPKDDSLYVTQAECSILHRASVSQRFRKSDDMGSVGVLDEGFQRGTIWEVCSKVNLLVIDELGNMKLPPDEMMLLDELLKHRYEYRLPTILVSNLPLKSATPDRPGLKEFLGDALSDRILHASGNGEFIMQFSGESFRRAARQNYFGSE